MSARFFTLDYLEQATLRDGTRVRIRLVRPSDKETLRAGFDRLSPAARYTRFLSSRTSLSEAELRYLSEVDQENHFAIGAVLDRDDDPAGGPPAPPAEPSGDPPPAAEPRSPSPAVGLGVARFVRLPDRPDTAEAAIAVADEAQHKGLGKLLFLRLAAAAAERGVERFRCEVLASNASMTALLAQIAPERTIEVGAGVMSIEFVLPGVTPTEPPSTAQLHGPIYRLFRAAARTRSNGPRRCAHCGAGDDVPLIRAAPRTGDQDRRLRQALLGVATAGLTRPERLLGTAPA